MAYKQLKLWFDEELAKMLAEKIQPLHPDFNKRQFIQKVKKGVTPLELKARVELMADLLQEYISKDFESSWNILEQILGEENEKETGMFTEGYWIMPIAKFVEKYGLEDFEISMKAIEEITKRNTGEYAIRPFIEKYPKRTMKRMLRWSKNKNKHIRRLASEGCRPKLPWASKLQIFIEDPSPILPILENLKDDKSKYIQKSVANNMNDILKNNYSIAIDILKKWSNQNPTSPRKWIIKHALRNQLKQKNPTAFDIINRSNKD
ncbi:MAG: DNA alkylation repair protein [Saprospiraceae bacterium]